MIFGSGNYQEEINAYVYENDPSPLLDVLRQNRAVICLSLEKLYHTVEEVFDIGPVAYPENGEMPSEFIARVLVEDENFVMAATRFESDLFIGFDGNYYYHPDGHQIVFYAHEQGTLIAKDSAGNRGGGPEIFYSYDQVDDLLNNNMKNLFLACWLK